MFVFDDSGSTVVVGDGGGGVGRVDRVSRVGNVEGVGGVGKADGFSLHAGPTRARTVARLNIGSIVLNIANIFLTLLF
jgi:hypothetical protein